LTVISLESLIDLLTVNTCITVNTSHTFDITINRSVNDCNNNCINLLSLNCCGIKSRLQYPEFQNMIRNHDILCFVETKTDDLVVINFPGFKILYLPKAIQLIGISIQEYIHSGA
jgi:hypothetical protein